MTLASRMSGGHLLAWALSVGAEFSAEVDTGSSYRRLRVRNGREPLGCIVASAGGRRWYFAPIESAADREARGLLLGLTMIGGGL